MFINKEPETSGSQNTGGGRADKELLGREGAVS